MTEREWQDCNDALQMLDYLRQQSASQRKLRLFGCARCRYFWHLFSDERARRAIEVSEKYADDQVTVAELQAASETIWASGIGQNDLTPSGRVVLGAANERDPTGEGCWDTAWDCYNGADPEEVAAMDAATKAEIPLIRDIFGNPFHNQLFDPSWRTPTALALAKEIYEERMFDTIPILADALEDAGCDDSNILSHCHNSGPHVRGCWVVDFLLEKK